MSTRCSGVARRSFISGSRLWPPAITRASDPSRASLASASSTLVARSYSNGAGTCMRVFSSSWEAAPTSRRAARIARYDWAVKRLLSDRLRGSTGGRGLAVTFAQLQAFSTVARLGSVKAAARSLGVSEPAISGAIASLRRDLGDDLFTRVNGGIALTAGGNRLASTATEILGLADRARRSVGEAQGDAELLRLGVTSAVAEYVAPALVDTFLRRVPGVEATVQVEPSSSFGDLLQDLMTDMTLGPRLGGDAALGIESVPFLRYRLIVVAGPQHRLASRRDLAPAALAGERWLVGPSGAEPPTAVGQFLARHRLAPHEVAAFPTYAAAGPRRGERGAGSVLALATARPSRSPGAAG